MDKQVLNTNDILNELYYYVIIDLSIYLNLTLWYWNRDGKPTRTFYINLCTNLID